MGVSKFTHAQRRQGNKESRISGPSNVIYVQKLNTGNFESDFVAPMISTEIIIVDLFLRVSCIVSAYYQRIAKG